MGLDRREFHLKCETDRLVSATPTATSSRQQQMVRTQDHSPRRSSRLKNRQAANNTSLAAQVKSTSAARTLRKSTSAAISLFRDTRGEDVLDPSPTKHRRASGSDRLRSPEITDKELDRRKELLLNKETELKNRSNELQRRIISLEKRETEASAMMLQITGRQKDCVVKQLEEHFLCSLCYEVLAAPYSLNPSRCGHTFCGLCILKWFFSRLHRHCGAWHESVDCPMCRSLLIITPEQIPRLQLTFPFVPNRIAASVIESLVAKLVEQPWFSQTKTGQEEVERKCIPKSRRKCRPYLRKEKNSEEESSKGSLEKSSVATWSEGGRMRTDWLERDRQGKQEMTHLLNGWSTMRAQDFIAMKEKFGV